MRWENIPSSPFFGGKVCVELVLLNPEVFEIIYQQRNFGYSFHCGKILSYNFNLFSKYKAILVILV